MNKKTVLLIIGLLLGTLLLILVGRNWYWHYYWETASPQQRSSLPEPDPCYVPWGVAVDGQAAAQVSAWEDLNANGIQETGEPALPKVMVLLDVSEYPYDLLSPPLPWEEVEATTTLDTEYLQMTDEAGTASVWQFKPGCACQCWEGDAVFAWALPAYEPTTPTSVPLTHDDQLVTFGFHKIE